MHRTFIAILAVAAATMCVLPNSDASPKRKGSTPLPANLVGKKTYEHHCAPCHLGGDNQNNPNKPLAGSAKLATLDEFKKYVGNNHVPFAKELVADTKTIEALYAYCKSLPKVASNPQHLALSGEDL
jgi:hypothetical protein